MQISYQTQRLSMRFFMLMATLFVVQVGFGLLLGLQQADPTVLAGTLNFNVVRAEHLSLGIFWILSGFIGAILFVGPLLSKRELAAPWLIKFLFYALIVTIVWNMATQSLAMKGIAGWWEGQPWLQQGLEYLEAGRAAQVVILIGFSILAGVVLRTFPPRKEWNEIHWGLAIGVVALTAVWLFGMFYVSRLDLQEYFRWFVVHYWVEGVWEVIHISLIGFLLVLLFKVDVKSVGYAVFWGVALVWLSGLLGNAHHYFWIGTPEFWQFWGSLLSAMEPLPLVFCFWHIYLDAHQNRRPLENAPAFYFILGSVVLEQVGAGILGFSMTFALTNAWSHGTWITPAHAHLALFGTFGMLGIGAAYYAVPAMREAANFDQRIGRLAFWMVMIGVLGMALSFALGGTVQIYVYRTLGLHWFGGDLFPAMGVYRLLVAVFGFLLAVGAGLIAFDLATIGKRTRSVMANHRAPRAASGWGRPLSGFEAGIWLTAMWVFGGIVTLSLLSYNLPRVRVDGDPTLPYLLAGIGYPGLLLVTVLFVWRFLASMEARTATAPAVMPAAAVAVAG
ncbi:MAG: nitric-oxide reductase [Rhodanobacter sp.]|nr:MAG: nitric-oxide reductase [Rhodanobacter sp.]TAM15188.1 MAG: nitric-oxide reductase [Rhodanobacter sp.]TAM36662.1 MAG: nitric-oxide reductase [Rhodanobacter sp.]